MAESPIVSSANIREIRRLVTETGLTVSRESLLGGISRAFVDILPLEKNPAEQILSDLNKMNSIRILSDGTIPLKVWMENAIHLFEVLPQGVELRRIYDGIQWPSGHAVAPKGFQKPVDSPEQTDQGLPVAHRQPNEADRLRALPKAQISLDPAPTPGSSRAELPVAELANGPSDEGQAVEEETVGNSAAPWWQVYLLWAGIPMVLLTIIEWNNQVTSEYSRKVANEYLWLTSTIGIILMVLGAIFLWRLMRRNGSEIVCSLVAFWWGAICGWLLLVPLWVTMQARRAGGMIHFDRALNEAFGRNWNLQFWWPLAFLFGGALLVVFHWLRSLVNEAGETNN